MCCLWGWHAGMGRVGKAGLVRTRDDRVVHTHFVLGSRMSRRDRAGTHHVPERRVHKDLAGPCRGALGRSMGRSNPCSRTTPVRPACIKATRTFLMVLGW